MSCGSDYARGLVGFIEVNGPRKGGSFIHPVPLLSVRTLENFDHSFPHRDVCMPSANSSTPISMLSKPFEEQTSYVHNFDTRAVPPPMAVDLKIYPVEEDVYIERIH